MMGYIHENDFVVESLNPARNCTPYSVAAHTLYEKGHPYLLPGPGGTTDLEGCTFTQVDPHSIQVTGSKYHRSEQYVVKLEGAKLSGYRSIFIAGIRDPKAIACIDEIIDSTHATVKDNFPEIDGKNYFMDYKIYGKNGVMRDWEPQQKITSQELCVLVEVVTPTQADASAICSFCRSTMLHFHYKGRHATAGNLAFPFAPSDFDTGPVYEFNVYHLVPIDDPVHFFQTEYTEIGQGRE